MLRLTALAATLIPLLHAADPLYHGAQAKLDAIQAGTVPRGSTVVFSLAEINAYAVGKVPEVVPEGIRNQRVELGAGTATAYALADFLKMRQAKGTSTNRLMAMLLEGERPIKVSIRLTSEAGRCTVYLTRVEVSNAVAQGVLLDFLIKTFFLPLYPDAKIDEPFELGYNIERIEIQPSGIRVAIKK